MNVAPWLPPDDPNPFDILHSAVDDTRDGLYPQALAKFRWFHQNATRYQPSLGAVRLSFALAYWLDLAEVYPPASDAFLRTRDEAEAAFRQGSTDFNLFHEIASLSRHLGDGDRTADLFVELAETDLRAAESVYHVAERYLVAAGRFHACGPFLDTHRRLASAAGGYRVMQQCEHEDSAPERDFPIPKTARKFYIEETATLVALLVLNGRAEEAASAYQSSLQVFDDTEFRTIMDAAITGHLPESRL